MARKKPHDDRENHDRWLVSYADFVTLLFAFFVVMYSISSVNEGKYRVLSDSMVTAFRSAQKALAPIQVGQPSKSSATSQLELKNGPQIVMTPVIKLPSSEQAGGDAYKVWIKKFESDDGQPPSGNIRRMAEDVARALSHLVDQGLVAVRGNDLWLEIEIKDSILFSSGSAQLRPDAVPVLNQVAGVLRGFRNSVRVEGFTDNIPIRTLVYPSNWELSAARAASVVRLLAKDGIDPKRMSALGYGEHRPLADNGTPEGRSANRRVVLVVLADKEIERLVDDRLVEIGSHETPHSEVHGTLSARTPEDNPVQIGNALLAESRDVPPRGIDATSQEVANAARSRKAPSITPKVVRSTPSVAPDTVRPVPRPLSKAPRPIPATKIISRFPVIEVPITGREAAPPLLEPSAASPNRPDGAADERSSVAPATNPAPLGAR